MRPRHVLRSLGRSSRQRSALEERPLPMIGWSAAGPLRGEEELSWVNAVWKKVWFQCK